MPGAHVDTAITHFVVCNRERATRYDCVGAYVTMCNECSGRSVQSLYK
jgi:drug/metabolite transporter superfamily protein YnfA